MSTIDSKTTDQPEASEMRARDTARSSDASFVAKSGNGLVVVSLWCNRTRHARLYFTWKAQFKYRDTDGQTNYIGTSDEHMPTVAAILLQQAWPWCGEQRRAAAAAVSESNE